MPTQPAASQVTKPLTEVEQILERNKDKANWEWVEVPEEDIFGRPHTGVSVNMRSFGPGKHYVDPEMAGEIKRLLKNRMRGDIRVLQPHQDRQAVAFMGKTGGEIVRGQ